MIMHRAKSLIAAVCLIPLLAPSPTKANILDRYEAGLETFPANFSAFYVSRIPALDGNMPSTE